MTKSAAAKLWAKLEQRLIGRCGLRDGLELLAERAHLIKIIGEATARTDVPQTVGATASARRPVADFNVADWAIPDSQIDAMLSKHLDRACGLRGYDGGDEV